MKINLIKPSVTILHFTPNPIQFIERCGRVCYKSEDKITDDSARKFVSGLIKSGHHSVIEHVTISCHVICDRGVSHELVRHRLASFSQESTRYCNYKDEMSFVIPPWLNIEEEELLVVGSSYDEIRWKMAISEAASCYDGLLHNKQTPQQARAVLPNSLKTELVITANLREWRHIYSLRSSKAAHPQMRELMELFKEAVVKEEELHFLFQDLFKKED